MSSIFGIFNYDKSPVQDELLQTMQDDLCYWKPDRSDIWTANHIGLGQLTLRITQQSKNESLPKKIGDHTIVFNGRIDKRDELFKKLDLKFDPSFPDGDLVLYAYKKWGKDCPTQLSGEFTFVIWDNIEQTLFCVKDHIGTRPLYYAENNNKFIFSSEIKGILASKIISKEINQLMIGMHLLGFKGEQKQTTYKHIHIIPPGSWLLVSANGIQTQRYWDIRNAPALKFKNKQDYIDGFTEELIKSVERRTNSIFPVATLLSGGLDSTTVAGIQIKKNFNPSNLHLFSWAHKEGDDKEYFDDREYINDFLSFHKGGDFQHSFLQGYPKYFNGIEKVGTSLDEPHRDIEFYTRFSTYEKAQEKGIRLLLGGIGGDHLTSNYAEEYIFDALTKLKLGSVCNELLSTARRNQQPLKSSFKKHILSPINHFICKKESWNLGHGQCGKNYLSSRDGSHYLHPNFVKKINLNEVIENHESNSHLPKNRLKNPLKQKLALDINCGELDVSFNQRYNASLSYNIQNTYPLLDRDLMNYSFGLPEDFYYLNGTGRNVIRQSMRGFVPENIINRTTKYPTSPYFRAIVRQELTILKNLIKTAEHHDVISQMIDLKKMTSDIYLFEKNGRKLNYNFVRAVFVIVFLNKNE